MRQIFLLAVLALAPWVWQQQVQQLFLLFRRIFGNTIAAFHHFLWFVYNTAKTALGVCILRAIYFFYSLKHLTKVSLSSTYLAWMEQQQVQLFLFLANLFQCKFSFTPFIWFIYNMAKLALGQFIFRAKYFFCFH